MHENWYAPQRMDAWYLSADDITPLMRDWLTGKRFSAPSGVHFECSEQLAATLKAQPPKPAQEWTPHSVGVFVGSLADLTGMPIITRADLHGRQWQLTAPVAGSVYGGVPGIVTCAVMREGTAENGKPTALDRTYWLVDFHAVIGVERGWEIAGDPAVRRQLARFVHACGHDCDERDMKVTHRAGERAWDPTFYRADVAVPRDPVEYPAECGDWLCRDEAHWKEADPVDEPAVFAGAVTEKRYAEPMLADRSYWVPDLGRDFRDRMAWRRRQAEGEPLWTIDVRPKR